LIDLIVIHHSVAIQMLTFARYYVQELMAAKDRQDVETAAQRETLQVRSLSSSVVDP
jgi:hypothetical protein